jgi:hypothetical protein
MWQCCQPFEEVIGQDADVLLGNARSSEKIDHAIGGNRTRDHLPDGSS